MDSVKNCVSRVEKWESSGDRCTNIWSQMSDTELLRKENFEGSMASYIGIVLVQMNKENAETEQA